MNNPLIFWPVLVQILLTCAVFIMLGKAKSKAARLGEVNEEKRALHGDAWPDYVLKISNNINNQFETPVLFYALVFMLWALQAVDIYALICAWGYALSRLVHAYIHTGSNYVPARRKVFTVGVMFLITLAILCIKALLLS